MSTSNTDTGDTAPKEAAVQTLSAIGFGTPSSAATPPPREALIATAVNFLQNAKVRSGTLLQKQQFLQSKGLTLEEIQLACERAGIFGRQPGDKPTYINMGFSSSSQIAPMSLQPVAPPALSAFVRIREVLHSIALMSGLAYLVYKFYQRYIVPLLFGSSSPKKPIEDALQSMEEKVEKRLDEVGQELTQLKQKLDQSAREQKEQMNREFNVFRSDLEAIKGLLLNRKQFAAPLTGVPPSIPAWQLSSTQHHRHRLSQSDDNEKADDAGSGSGSSETEVVTKNSDSSIEIM